MLNVHHSGVNKSENDRVLDNIVLTLVSGEDSGWFKDSDMSIFSLDSVEEIDRLCKGEYES